MTVSANYSLDPSRDQLITMAFRLSGLLEAGKSPSQNDVNMASDFFNLELMNLQAEGVILRTVERASTSLTASTASYSLAADAIDIEIGPNDQAGTVNASGGSDTVVTVMARHEYQDIASKTITGLPSRVYVEKLATITCIFWPVPDTAYTFKYSKVRLLRDMDSGTVTTDLARRWLQAVVYAIASQICLAKSMPLDRVSLLRNEAERLKQRLHADDSERGKIHMHIAHSGRR